MLESDAIGAVVASEPLLDLITVIITMVRMLQDQIPQCQFALWL